MALVYSYIRMSTRKQLEGDSLKRQVTMGEEWIAKNGHTAASLVLQDLGKSSFRGQNKATGRLRAFLDEIDSGRVKPGDIFLCEHLDRLSRQGVDEAQELFKSILKKGVLIAVLRPTETVYTRESLNDFTGLLIPLIGFYEAYLSSKSKSDRLYSVWKTKREQFVADGTPLNAVCPAWLTYDPTTKKFVPNEGAAAIRYIFEKTALDWGQRQVLAGLQKDFKAIGRGSKKGPPKWQGSYVQSIISDRSVLGERQNYQFVDREIEDEEGNRKTITERVPIGDPIKDYFPAVIEEDLWHRAQLKKKQRTRQRGPSSGFINLFTGLIRNAHDASMMHLTLGLDKKGGKFRRLMSSAHLNRVPDADPVTVDYWAFEVAMLKNLSEVRIEDLEPRVDTSLLRAKEQERAGIDGQLAELQVELTNPAKGTLGYILKAIAKLEDDKDRLNEEITKINESMHTSTPLAEAKSLFEMMLERVESDDTTAYRAFRSRLRVLLMEMIEEIRIKPEKHHGRVFFLATCYFRNGHVTKIVAHPAGSNHEPPTAQEWAIDLRDQATCRAFKVFERVAGVVAGPVVVVPSGDGIKTLGDGLAAWLAEIATTIKPTSYRTIPYAVRRFADYVGTATPIADLGQGHWDLWLRSLRLEIAEGKITPQTARIAYTRTREFLRWLEGRGGPRLSGLDTIAIKAIG